MSLWEYKIITSGKGGFARPDLLEKFLNDLGRDEWEIIEFHSAPDNFLVFTGLARRPTQRDWTLEDAAAAAAKVEAEKLRAEFEAKFKAATAPAPVEERPSDFLEEKVAPDDGFRKPIDTSHDADPEAVEDEDKDEWDQLTAAEDEELPTFFEAIKPHMRRNQRGPGMSVGVDYLAKKWDQSEDDLKNALLECGFVLPEDEDAKPEYVEYDGDLYWVNVNRRGELWINTKEKPRPVFRPVKAQKVVVDEERKTDERGRKPQEDAPKADPEGAPAESGEPKSEPLAGEGGPTEVAEEEAATARAPKGEGGSAELPQGPALLKKIRPHMRRNRRGPGGSGSTSFLSRALKCSEDDLKTAFAALGLKVPASASEKPSYLEVGNEVWWLNADSRGGLWINGREKRAGEVIGAAEPEAPAAPEAAPVGEPAAPPTEQPAVLETAAADTPPLGERESSGEPATGPAAVEATVARPTITEAVVAEAQPLTPPTPSAMTETAAPVAPILTEVAPAAEPLPPGIPTVSSGAGIVERLRPLLKEAKSGAVAARVDQLAGELGQPADELIAAVVAAGMKVPEKPREKPVFVEHGGEVLWLSRNARGDLFLNAKTAKLGDEKAEDDDGDAESAADEDDADPEKKGRRPRSRKKSETEGA